MAVYVPGAHGVSLAEPTEQKVPAAQTMQSLIAVITDSDESMCVPPGQGSGAADPSVQ